MAPNVVDNVVRIWTKLRRQRFVTALLGLILLVVALDRAFPLRMRVPYSPVVTAADGTLLFAQLSADDKWRLYAELSDVTPALQQAILYKEDRYFYHHPGINPVALLRAAVRNGLTGRRTSGASTITMQTVRLLDRVAGRPRPRTYASKAIEMLRALQLELHYPKADILQLYLNLLPYGGNVEGIKSAALLYFGKPPLLLSLAEIATLTIIPNRPSSLRLARNGHYVVQERNRYLRRLADAGRVSTTLLHDALTEPLTARRRRPPRLAPHLSQRLIRQHPHEPILASSLRLVVQSTVERLTERYVARWRALGIQNAAVLVVNNQTGAVEAYVGSADYADRTDGGQVDGVRAVRSPGSTLKPLLYALAIDAGHITPKTRLLDVPTDFGGYEPVNYDAHFNGPVTAEFALANSLNLPAVSLLNQLGLPAMLTPLRRAGFATIRRQAPELGLSLILGGCGVTLEELTRLFTAFANGGQLRPLRYTSQPFAPEKSQATGPVGAPALVSPEAAYLVTRTLTQITRPDLPNNFDNSYRLPRIAWKTGTSYGRRDAWSIGYNRHYTVGVWLGNFSGVGVPELSGANTATPLLFRVFNAIDYNSPASWFRPPARSRLAQRVVCATSGDVPDAGCTGRVVDYYVMGVSRHQRCQHRRAVLTNAAGTLAYCAHCRPDLHAPTDSTANVVTRYYDNLPPALLAFYAASHRPYARLPPHNPTCDRLFAGAAPVITSPHEGRTYYVDAQAPAELALSCQAAADVRTVYWYVNDRLLRRAGPAETVFYPAPPGTLKISCADDRGRYAHVQTVVRRQ